MAQNSLQARTTAVAESHDWRFGRVLQRIPSRSTPQPTQLGVSWTPATCTPSSTSNLVGVSLLEAKTYYC